MKIRRIKSMKKLLAVFMAVLTMFGTFSAALAKAVAPETDAEVRTIDLDDAEMIETDLPSGIYDDGRTLIIHPDDEDILCSYDPDDEASVSTNSADAQEKDEAWILTEPMVTPKTLESLLYVPQIGLLKQPGEIESNSLPIKSVKDLYEVRRHPERKYYLTRDLDISDLSRAWGLSWTPIPGFSGVLDGRGHKIKGLTSPLFEEINGTDESPAAIKNLEIKVCFSGSMNTVGAFAQGAAGRVVFDNCLASGTMDINTGGNLFSGGFVGLYGGTESGTELSFSWCYNALKLTAEALGICEVGGFLGSALWNNGSGSASFSHCLNRGEINAVAGSYGYIGGIVGVCKNSEFYDCRNAKSITFRVNGGGTTNSNVGGIVGRTLANPNVEKCSNKGSVTVTAESGGTIIAGGLFGRSENADFTECINAGTVKAVSENTSSNAKAYSGGISGSVGGNGMMTKCVNNAKVTANAEAGKAYAGGLTATGGGFDAVNCYVDNTIKAVSAGGPSYSGGVIGYCDVYASAFAVRVVTSNISAKADGGSSYAYAGGFAGYAKRTGSGEGSEFSALSLGCCLTNNAEATCENGTAYRGSVAGFVEGKLSFFDVCAYNVISYLAGSYDSSEGLNYAYAFYTDIHIGDAEYIIKAVDSLTGEGIGNANVYIDGYVFTTNSVGMVRATLPISMIIKMSVIRSDYEIKNKSAVLLSTYKVNLVKLDYVGDPESGSGGGSGGSYGTPSVINVGGRSIKSFPLQSPKIALSGPDTTVNNNTSPAYKFDFGVNLPHCSITFKYDSKKETLRILLNADESADISKSEDESSPRDERKIFNEKWDNVVDGIQKYVDKGVTDVFKEFKGKKASIGTEGTLSCGGYMLISLVGDKISLLGSGMVLKFEAETKFKVPFWAILFVQLKLSVGIGAKIDVTVDGSGVIDYSSALEFSIGVKLLFGIGDPIGIVSAAGGVKAEQVTTISFPFIDNIQSVSAEATLSLIAEFTFFVFSNKISYEWSKVQIWPRNKEIEAFNLTPYLNSESMQLQPRDYLKNTSVLRAAGDDSLVMNSVYPNGEPKLVQLEDGRLVLVWVHDDGSRTSENRTALYYSIYDGGVWSEPAILLDDGTADFCPIIAADGNSVHIVWQNMSEVIPEGAELDYYLSRTQLCYTKLNGDGTVDEPFIIDPAGYYQAGLCMAEENGNLIVGWKENSENNIWNECGNYSPYSRTLMNGSWSETEKVGEYAAVYETACGFVEGQPRFAFIADNDGDSQTADDSEIFEHSSSSFKRRVTSNAAAERGIQYTPNGVCWKENDELRNEAGSLGLTSEDEVILMTAPDGSLVAVMKSSVDGFNTELYGSFLNSETGEWSVPAPLTNYYGFVSSFSPIVLNDGTVAIALDESEIVNESDPFGPTSMHVIVGSTLTDLIVTSGVGYDEDEILPGETIPMTVSVYNNSINPVCGAVIGFYDDNDNCVFTANVNETIECGEEKELSFDYPIPAQPAYSEYTVKVFPTGVEDDIPTNNTSKVYIGYSDVSIENTEFIRTETAGQIAADVSNVGFENAESVLAVLKYGGEDGEILGSFDLGDMEAGASEHLVFDIPPECLVNESERDLNTFYLSLESDSFELHAANNTEIIVDEPIRVSGVNISCDNAELLVHETVQLTAAVEPADAANQLIVWSSDNTDVAVVDENGLVEAVGEGEAVIYAISTDGSYSAGCTVNTQCSSYTVTFLDWDGTVLGTETVKETYDAAPPEPPEREGYTFIGWDGSYTGISGDITLTAQYELTDHYVFYYANGELIHSDLYHLGDEVTPLAVPDIEGFTFIGWSEIPAVMPDDDVIVIAETVANSYIISYYVDGELYGSSTYEYGAEVIPIDEPELEDHVFSGWVGVPETMPANDVSVYGTFSIAEFTVTFLDWDGSVIDEQQVEIHSDAIAPEDPERPGWTFTGWQGDYTNVTENREIIALYELIVTYVVTFVDRFGVIIENVTVAHGEAAEAPEAPFWPGHVFTGWDRDLSCVTSDMLVRPIYELSLPDESTVLFSTGAVTAMPGGYVTGSVEITGEYEANALTAALYYDADLLTFSSISVGDVWSGISELGGSAMAMTDYPGSIRFIAVLPEGAFSANGTVFSVSFHVSEEAEIGSQIPLSLEILEFYKLADNVPEQIDFAVVNGAVTVNTLLGDVNMDGTLTSIDALLILRHVIGLITLDNIEAADVSGDGTVNSLDALIVLRTVLGLI